MNWSGVMPAMTTAFDSTMAVDHPFMAQHAAWMLDNGCVGLVALGSLGEGATLAADEKRSILRNLVTTLAGRAPGSCRHFLALDRSRCTAREGR